MQSFVDKTGRSWAIEMTCASMRRVKSMTGHDLTEPFSPGVDEQTPADVVHKSVLDRVDILWAICKPAADVTATTEEEFATSLGGTAMRAAKAALIEEWQDFFRSLGQVEVAEALRKMSDLNEAIQAEARTQMERLSQAMIDQGIQAVRQEADRAINQLTAPATASG